MLFERIAGTMNRFYYGLALILVVACMPVPVRGQESPQIGLTLGLNVTSIEASGADVGVRQMFAGGLVAQVGLYGPLSVQSQLLLNQKGAVVNGDTEAIRYGASYVDLPVLLRLEAPSLGRVTPFLVAGAFGGVKVFERQRGGSSGRSLPLNTNTSFFKRTNAGLTAGVAGTLEMSGDRRINLAVRYGHGLTDVARSIDDQPFTDSDGRPIAPFPDEAHTRTVSVMVRLGI